MVIKIRVDVRSRDGSPVVEAYRTIGGTAGALAAASACAWSVEGRKLTVGTSQESMLHTVRINVNSRDRPELIEAWRTTGTTCALVAASTRTWNVKRFQFALGVAHEVVMNKVAAVVLVASNDDSKCINVGSPRTVTTLRSVGLARAWTNPCRKRAVGPAQESAERIVRVGVVAYNGSLQINRFRKGPVTSRVWWVKRCELPVRTAQKPVG